MSSTAEPTPSPTKQRRLIILIAVVLALIAGSALAAPLIKQRLEAPLGPALELPTYTPTVAILLPSQTATPAPTLAPGSPSSTPTELPTATTPPTATPAPLCGGPPLTFILGIGVDTDDDSYTYGLGDAIRIARVDFVTPRVTVLTLPRDLWVEIPGISDHYGITHGKLNQSYFYGTPGMGYYDGPGGGAGLMARTLDLNFGLRVEHYGAINMITFARVIDAVGGITVYLPYDVDGTPIDNKTDDMGYFYAGKNEFSGEEAMRFMRIRKRYNDFTRTDHQNMVICALWRKLRSPKVLPKIPDIIASFKDQVITDLSLAQMGQFACLLPYLKSENIILASLPQEIFTPGEMLDPRRGDTTFILQVDNQVIRSYIQQFISGEWPTPDEEGGPSCP